MSWQLSCGLRLIQIIYAFGTFHLLVEWFIQQKNETVFVDFAKCVPTFQIWAGRLLSDTFVRLLLRIEKYNSDPPELRKTRECGLVCDVVLTTGL